MQTSAWDQFQQQKTISNFGRWLGDGFTRVALVIGLFILIQVPPVAMVVIKKHPHIDTVVLVTVALFVIIFLAIIYLAYRLYRKYDQLKLPTRFAVKDLKTVLLGYLAIYVGQMVLGSLNKIIYHQTQTANNDAVAKLMASNLVITVVFSISTVLFTPFAEEFIFRGVVMNLFFKKDQFWPKVLLSAIIFSMGHASTNIVSFLIYFYMGAVLAYVYRKTGKIQNSIMLHMLNNLVAIVAMLAMIN
jgi:membrane protease YdiL (CAAX protease family)